MTRALRLLVLVLVCWCRQNRPPSQPILGGPTLAWPDDSLRFWVVAADPDQDHLSYSVRWQDGSDSAWSEWVAPASRLYLVHVFTDSGDYPLVAQARDQTSGSALSATLLVRVREYGPSMPSRPSGPDRLAVNDTARWVTRAYHPLAKPVAVRFDWGDTLDEWSGFAGSGTQVLRWHGFSRGGRHVVKAQAKDEREHLSDWSLPETVLVIDTFLGR